MPALLLLSAFPLSTHCTSGGEYTPALCPSGLPAIVALTIERNGAEAWVEKVQRPNCARFRLTVAQARRYLTRARRTDPTSADATMNESPCYAAGRVRYADGRTAQWDIDQFGEAHLYFPGQDRSILFCPECLSQPFLK